MGDGAEDQLRRDMARGLPHSRRKPGKRPFFRCHDCGAHARGARGVMDHQNKQHGARWDKAYILGNEDPPEDVWAEYMTRITVTPRYQDPAGKHFLVDRSDGGTVEVSVGMLQLDVNVYDAEGREVAHEPFDVDPTWFTTASAKSPAFCLRENKNSVLIGENAQNASAQAVFLIKADDGKSGGLSVVGYGPDVDCDIRVKPSRLDRPDEPASSPKP